MSQSFRKYPFIGNACSSDKEWKRKNNRRLRARIRMGLHHGNELLHLMREITNVYGAPKDGRHRFRDLRFMRK